MRTIIILRYQKCFIIKTLDWPVKKQVLINHFKMVNIGVCVYWTTWVILFPFFSPFFSSSQLFLDEQQPKKFKTTSYIGSTCLEIEWNKNVVDYNQLDLYHLKSYTPIMCCSVCVTRHSVSWSSTIVVYVIKWWRGILLVVIYMGKSSFYSFLTG